MDLRWLGPVLKAVVQVVGDSLGSWPRTTRLALLLLVIGAAVSLVAAANGMAVTINMT
ncbi:hypothetical protein ABH917_004018 [Thermobifida halotolerans]